MPQSTGPVGSPNILSVYGASTLALKTGTGVLFACYAINRNASPRFLQGYAAANSAAGTPIFSVQVPYGGSSYILDAAFFSLRGASFADGITLAISTTENSYVAPTASDHSLTGVFS